MRKRVLIMGSTGMLGFKILETLKKDSDLEIFSTSRILNNDKRNFVYNYGIQSVVEILNEVNPHFIVNCIGKIKPFIRDNDFDSKLDAINLNSIFPIELIRAAEAKGIKVIQIGTDCVFSGFKGSYSELALHDATDVYGMSKSLGEISSKNVMLIRCSIIGPEKSKKVSLLEWFLSQPKNARIQGFRNHVWNGVSTLHFALLCQAIIKTFNFESGIFHFLPRDKVSKDILLTHFSRHFGREDIQIDSRDAAQAIDRSLSTLKPEFNLKLWNLMGYVDIPNIEDLVREMAMDYKLTQ